MSETAPGAPNITADPTIGATTLIFAWTAPDSDGGSEITSYTLSDVNTPETQFILQLYHSPYTVTGLTNGTAYTFQILATNIAGDGDAAIYNQAVPVDSIPPPQLIGGYIRPIVSDSTIQIYWSEPLNLNEPVVAYILYIYSGDINNSLEIPSTPLNYTFTDLSNGTDYSIKIAARIGTKGDQIGSFVFYRTVQPGNKPSIPTSISVTNPTSTSALVTWSAPSDNGGATIKWYVITPYSSDPADPFTAYNSSASAVDASYGHYGKKSANGTDTSILFTGLTEGNTYTFGVSAVNDPGYSPVLVST